MKNLIHEVRSVDDELSGLCGDVLDSFVDIPVLQKHFLVVGLYLLVVPVSDEFGHMKEDLVLLADGLALERPFVVAKVRDIRIILGIVPCTIFLIFSLSKLGPSLFWLRILVLAFRRLPSLLLFYTCFIA